LTHSHDEFKTVSSASCGSFCLEYIYIYIYIYYYYYYLAGCTTFPHLPAPVEHL